MHTRLTLLLGAEDSYLPLPQVVHAVHARLSEPLPLAHAVDSYVESGHSAVHVLHSRSALLLGAFD